MVTEDLVVPALYEADVAHARLSPLTHRFRYRATYWLVDFDQLPRLRGMARWGGVRRADHVDIRSVLSDRGIAAARVLMLSGARTFGYTFDPISIFWCYDGANVLTAVVAEVHNTYGERHAYVLAPDGETVTEKAMYVSPFNPADGTYRIRVSAPTSSVSVRVSLEGAQNEPFVATLRGKRQPLTMRSALSSALRHSSIRTRVLIQWQALRLWRRGLKVQPR